MTNHFNPFKENRTEQMHDLWKFYVPFSGLDGTAKPLIVQGGRGSGKTMLFQCNSWRQILSKLRKNGEPSSNLFSVNGFVGIYYRVDTTFVAAMCNREETNWDKTFNTYFSVCILQEIIDMIIALQNDMPVSEGEIASFVSLFSSKLCKTRNVQTLLDFKKETNWYLDRIEDKINGDESQNADGLRMVNADRIIRDACEACQKIFNTNILFKIFIDEYETLQVYQQQIVNTLIKHSAPPVVFNIGLRPEGMKTSETISQTETIESPHDYESLQLSLGENYEEILKAICQKRIASAVSQGKIPDHASDNIEYYLGAYQLDDELTHVCKGTSKFPHLENLDNLIRAIARESGLSQDETQLIVDELCYNAPILNSRLHYALLNSSTTYAPDLRGLCKEYKTNSNKYKDWMHNRGYGLIFLLCHETKQEKMYYGFNSYTILSSGIVRYFLELCEQAFRIAFLDDYDWSSPLSAEIQTEAAKYVSEYKIVDIAGYKPYGRELKVFVHYIGRLFNKLHTDSQSSLGEPEPNHFNTKDLSLSSASRSILQSAIMCNVLYGEKPTKRKQSTSSPETVDYYLNKIYTPYFGISYRDQRKIQIDTSVLDKLLSGNEDVARNGIDDFFSRRKRQSSNDSNSNSQLSLFDRSSGGSL